ncbi:MAG TPA: type II toxin-antitoxin system Phd/YefM family antitoxin [Terriglobales bacterium]
MKTVPAGKFKAQCLKLMDQVKATRQPLLITKKGRPVAKLVPAEGPVKDIFGCMKDKVEIVGDILAPVVPPEDWELLG